MRAPGVHELQQGREHGGGRGAEQTSGEGAGGLIVRLLGALRRQRRHAYHVLGPDGRLLCEEQGTQWKEQL